MEKVHSVPLCVGVIMDGNRRWARNNGLPVYEGHRTGYQRLKDLAHWAKDVGVGTVIVYAFSEENWKRTEEELGYMMKLLRFVLTDLVEEAMKDNIRLKFIGTIEKFADDIANGMRIAEQKTQGNTGVTLVVASSYGGRQEILRAANELVEEKRALGTDDSYQITREDFEKHLYTTGLPDPDIIIRTSGEFRLSGFLPWQMVYSELFFTQTLWPDFSKEEFGRIVNEFGLRQRRLGK